MDQARDINPGDLTTREGAAKGCGPLAHPVMLASEIYRHSRYGPKHPLAIPRVSLCVDLCRALGWLPEGRYIDCAPATPAQLARFHDPGYIAAVQAAERNQSVPSRLRDKYGLGRDGNPIFPEVFSRHATASASSIRAAQLLTHGGIVHSPAGGTHHGRPDRASGFCYFNDPALGILEMLDGGLSRIAYVDIDAHHGDGVQDAFHDDQRVLTVSIHEAKRWPNRDPLHGHGGLYDRAGGAARNIPVPQGLNDSEFGYVFEAAILPLVEAFEPEALVLQCGCNGLADDPMSKLSLSNGAIWRAVAQALPLAPRVLVLGGGGYNPYAVGRCWSGIWAGINGYDVPAQLPAEAAAVLAEIDWRHRLGRNPPTAWLTTLADAPRGGSIREEIKWLVAETLRD